MIADHLNLIFFHSDFLRPYSDLQTIQLYSKKFPPLSFNSTKASTNSRSLCVFFIILLPKNDYRYKILPGWATMPFLFAETVCQIPQPR